MRKLLAILLSLAVPASPVLAQVEIAAPVEALPIEPAGYGPAFEREVAVVLDRFDDHPSVDFAPAILDLKLDLAPHGQRNPRNPSAFVLSALFQEPAASRALIEKAALSPAISARLTQAAARIKEAARKDKQIAQALADAEGAVRGVAERSQREKPAAPIPVHLKDWGIFFDSNPGARGSWGQFAKLQPDGSAIWRFPEDAETLASAASYKLTEVFPEYSQPSGDSLLLPPPHEFRARTAALTGFELEFPKSAKGRTTLSAKRYLGVLSQRRYPMRDEHDPIVHWPELFNVASGQYADIAKTALGLEGSPLAERGLGRDLISAIQRQVSADLDRDATSSRNFDDEDRPWSISWHIRELFKLHCFSDRIRLLAPWAARQGPFGRILAKVLAGGAAAALVLLHPTLSHAATASGASPGSLSHFAGFLLPAAAAITLGARVRRWYDGWQSKQADQGGNDAALFSRDVLRLKEESSAWGAWELGRLPFMAEHTLLHPFAPEVGKAIFDFGFRKRLADEIERNPNAKIRRAGRILSERLERRHPFEYLELRHRLARLRGLAAALLPIGVAATWLAMTTASAGSWLPALALLVSVGSLVGGLFAILDAYPSGWEPIYAKRAAQKYQDMREEFSGLEANESWLLRDYDRFRGTPHAATVLEKLIKVQTELWSISADPARLEAITVSVRRWEETVPAEVPLHYRIAAENPRGKIRTRALSIVESEAGAEKAGAVSAAILAPRARIAGQDAEEDEDGEEHSAMTAR